MLSNLRLLKSVMEDNDWAIDAFNFQFNNYDYVVIVELYGENEHKPEYSLVKLDFVDIDDLNRHYQIHANTRGFVSLDVKSFREFFRIPYGDGLGNVIQGFKRQLGESIPSQIHDKSNLQKIVMVNSLSRADSKDPNRLYPSHLANTGNRTIYNSNKARIIIEDLYNLIIDRNELSVCFAIDPARQRTAQEILRNYADN
ncbi:DUF6037 family protein [uncultured Psychrobacter sp.]|uniref:DUF6037 family protein n=1 Tax=uncultured Psychrobacter sp. TaxID=259303 RepID=UPI003458C804